MKLRYLIAVVATALMTTGITSCNGNKGGETQQSNAPVADTTSQVIDDKDEVTFLTTFLGNYIKSRASKLKNWQENTSLKNFIAPIWRAVTIKTMPLI
ncbi:MAG: hypothetical protein IIT96_02590 [Muribaculaceae bacterium]|nr:hypothetical protein [Muribaculaceae bacterium]